MQGVGFVLSAAVESSVSGTAAGPVGLIAVTAGVGGLVYGFVKQRRRPATVSAQNQRVDLVQQDTPLS